MTNWNWYGMWFWDYLNYDHDTEDSSPISGTAFTIWKQAYTQENPDLLGVGDLDLIRNHYAQAMKPVFNSWLFKAWRLFYLPSMTLRAIVWKLRVYLILRTSINQNP